MRGGEEGEAEVVDVCIVMVTARDWEFNAPSLSCEEGKKLYTQYV